jgi:type IV secretion system protein TrbL
MGSAARAAGELGREAGGSSLGGMARAGSSAAKSKLSVAAGLGAAAERGRTAAWNAMAGGAAPSPAVAPSESEPGWARQLRAQQTARHHRQMALQSLKEGDRGAASASPDIKERD